MQGRKGQGTSACCRVGWNLPDSEGTFIDLIQSTISVTAKEKAQPCRCLTFNHSFTSREGTEILGILIGNSRGKTEGGLWFWGDVLLPLYFLLFYDLLVLRSLFPSLLRGEISAQWHQIDPDTAKPHSGKGRKGKERGSRLVLLQFFSLVKALFLLISLFFKPCGLLDVQDRVCWGHADSIWCSPWPPTSPLTAHPILLLPSQAS